MVAGRCESAKDREGIVIKNRNENEIDGIRAKLPWIFIDSRSLEVTRALPGHYHLLVMFAFDALSRFSSIVLSH